MKPLLCLENEPRKPGKADRKFYLERVDALGQIAPDALADMDVRIFDLDFYEDLELGVVTGARMTPKGTRLCFLRRGRETWYLDGTSQPIHRANAECNLRISRTNLLEYLSFFCFFTRGESGPFFIFDRPENPFIPASPKRAELFEQFRSLKVWGQDSNGDWRISGLVYYADALFNAHFIVHLLGTITMVEDVPLVGQIGATIDAPLKAEGALAA